MRVDDRRGISHLCVARSADGLTGWVMEADRSLLPELGSHAERFGIEDPRITLRDCDNNGNHNEYLIIYTGYSDGGPRVCAAATRDLRTYERRGVLMPPEDKDAARFPCPLGGRWALIHRPVATTPGRPYLAVLGRPRGPAPRPRWDAHYIGLNTPGCARWPHVRFRPKTEIGYPKLKSRRAKAGSYTLIGYC